MARCSSTVVAAALALAFAACGRPEVPAPSEIVLTETDGSPHPLKRDLEAHAFTTVVFFSSHCPCQRAHDERLRELMAASSPKGVGFVVVDPAASVSAAEDAEESRSRGYPIVRDPGGKLARALGAEYATYSVVLDRGGRVVYRGGFDSNKSHLRDDRTQYLADALEDALAGRPLRRPEAKALGCTLEIQ